jgi:hypothetical protein
MPFLAPHPSKKFVVFGMLIGDHSTPTTTTVVVVVVIMNIFLPVFLAAGLQFQKQRRER